MATCDQDHVGEMTDAEVKAIEDLPESQKSAGRHKCTFCAYLLGIGEECARWEARLERLRACRLAGTGTHTRAIDWAISIMEGRE